MLGGRKARWMGVRVYTPIIAPHVGEMRCWSAPGPDVFHVLASSSGTGEGPMHGCEPQRLSYIWQTYPQSMHIPFSTSTTQCSHVTNIHRGEWPLLVPAEVRTAVSTAQLLRELFARPSARALCKAKQKLCTISALVWEVSHVRLKHTLLVASSLLLSAPSMHTVNSPLPLPSLRLVLYSHSCLWTRRCSRRQPSRTPCLLPGPWCSLVGPRLAGHQLVRFCHCQRAC